MFQKPKDELKEEIFSKLDSVAHHHRTELLSFLGRKKELCIHRVPDKLRQFKEDAYRPRVVSIGPLHGEDHKLGPMMRLKWFYMLSLFQPSEAAADPGECRRCLGDCLDAIYDLDQVVRQCYSDQSINYKPHELAEIILVDGCFILELFLRYDPHLNYYTKLKGSESDPILGSAWMITAIQHDLALLENQVPFFILQLLYDAVKPYVRVKCSSDPPDTVATLALKFFQPISRKLIGKDEVGTDFKHLLDLLHKFYFLWGYSTACDQFRIKIDSGLFSTKEESVGVFSNNATNMNKGFNYCASDLLKFGMRIEPGSSEDDLLNITFHKGVMKIPPLYVYETTSSLLRNLIAYEQCSLNTTLCVTSYVLLMNSLINHPWDSELLQRKGILNHTSIRDKESLIQFKTFVHEDVVKDDDFFLYQVCDQVHAYCHSWFYLRKLRAFIKERFQVYMVILFSTYFSSPWSFIKFLAACAILVLTSLQTYYTMNPR